MPLFSRKKLRQIFYTFNSDLSGTLNAREISCALTAIGLVNIGDKTTDDWVKDVAVIKYGNLVNFLSFQSLVDDAISKACSSDEDEVLRNGLSKVFGEEVDGISRQQFEYLFDQTGILSSDERHYFNNLLENYLSSQLNEASQVGRPQDIISIEDLCSLLTPM